MVRLAYFSLGKPSRRLPTVFLSEAENTELLDFLNTRSSNYFSLCGCWTTSDDIMGTQKLLDSSIGRGNFDLLRKES